MVNGTIDTDRWNTSSPGYYQDDAVYFGYTKMTNKDDPVLAADTYTTNWRSGGILRLMTEDSLNVSDWKLREVVSGTGPVTAAVPRLQDRKNHKLWLYFGDGRFFFNKDDYNEDSILGRKIYGIKDPCYTINDDLNPTCTDVVAAGAAADLSRCYCDRHRCRLAYFS